MLNSEENQELDNDEGYEEEENNDEEFDNNSEEEKDNTQEEQEDNLNDEEEIEPQEASSEDVKASEEKLDDVADEFVDIPGVDLFNDNKPSKEVRINNSLKKQILKKMV